MDINQLLCFDLWLTIAEIDPQCFIAVRSVNSAVRDYTNNNIDKYREKFSTKIVRISDDDVKITYYQLPNGVKHGLCQKFLPD